MDNVWLVGSPANVERMIREMYHEVGGFGVLLAMAHEWQPQERWVQSMTLLAQEVIPRLADLPLLCQVNFSPPLQVIVR